MRLHRGAVRKGLKEALSPGGRSVWSSRLVEEILGERLKAVRERTMREPWGWSPGLGRGRTVAPRRGFREKAKGQETSELHGDLTGGGVSLAVRQGLLVSGSISWSTSDSLTYITPGAFRLEEALTGKCKHLRAGIPLRESVSRSLSLIGSLSSCDATCRGQILFSTSPWYR